MLSIYQFFKDTPFGRRMLGWKDVWLLNIGHKLTEKSAVQFQKPFCCWQWLFTFNTFKFMKLIWSRIFLDLWLFQYIWTMSGRMGFPMEQGTHITANFPQVVPPRGTSFIFNIFSSTHYLGETGWDGRTERKQADRRTFGDYNGSLWWRG
jgi:hypothetical protein